MKGWTPQAADRANSLQKRPATSPATPTKGKTPQTGPDSLTDEETDEPATLPEGPELGYWKIGPFELRTTTTYAPTIRVVATGPAEAWPRLLAYLQAYQPCQPTKPTK